MKIQEVLLLLLLLFAAVLYTSFLDLSFFAFAFVKVQQEIGVPSST